jgi:hypothetical protein
LATCASSHTTVRRIATRKFQNNGPLGQRQLHCLAAIARLAHHRDIRFVGQELADGSSDDGVVVCHYHSVGSV